MTLALVLTAVWLATGVHAAICRRDLRDAGETAASTSWPAGGRPDLYEFAAVCGWVQRVVDTGVASLLERGAVAVQVDGKLSLATAAVEIPAGADVEEAVLAGVAAFDPITVADLRGRLAKDPAVTAVLERTEALGLVVETSNARRILRRGSLLTGATAIAAFLCWIPVGVGVAAFLVLGVGSLALVAAVLPARGLASRRGLELAAAVRAGAPPDTIIREPGVLTGAGWITAVYGIDQARRLVFVAASLQLPGDQSSTDTSGGGRGFLNWLLDDDGDGCGGCGCG